MIERLRDKESVVLTWALVTNLNLDKAVDQVFLHLIILLSNRDFSFKSTLQFIKINSKITVLEGSNIIFKMY